MGGRCLDLPVNAALLAADTLKEGALFAHCLRVPEEEVSAVVQRVMEEYHAFFLRLGLQVNKEVPADDEVELGERRVNQKVLPGEDHALADVLVDNEHVAVIG